MTDKHTEKIPYDTLIEYDPDLEVGRVVEDQAGVFGEKEITKTWKLENGKPVGDPTISETVTKDKQDRKIRVGTKCKCEPTPPVDPTEPTDPTDPTEPTEPTDPKDPTEPTDLTPVW
ncbi:G5 domain-containing protein [Corynebacterium striatum]|uniref:G5 domain-containing protein n=1 Tax=Corynebacterium striatum TaxID=43770 RepID=UPI003B591DF1